MPAHKLPNILFILTDDHAAHAISSYGSRINKTPQIDRLAQEGMRLENCFCTNAICTPARASILTGQYGHVNGVLGNGDTLDGRKPDLLQKLLGSSGYQRALFGKWHLGHGGHADPSGFDHTSILRDHGSFTNPLLIEQGIERQYKGYLTDILTDHSIDWLSARDRNRPFFLMLAHKAPHRPFVPSARQNVRYRDRNIAEPSTLFDDYANRSRAARNATMRIGRDLNSDDLKETPPEELCGEDLTRWNYQRFIKDYVRCCDDLDESTGRLLDYLRREGIEQNTIVIYTSDHGFFLGDHGWFDKRFMYEPSLRIPFLIRYPAEIGAGSVSRQIVANIDFAPTLLDYAGHPVPEVMQGRTARSLFRGDAPEDWPQSLYYRYWLHHDVSHRVCAHYGVRTDRYKLIHYYGRGLHCRGAGKEQTPPEWELFDLELDPDELHSLHQNPEYAPILGKLEAELARLQHFYRDHPEPSSTPTHG